LFNHLQARDIYWGGDVFLGYQKYTFLLYLAGYRDIDVCKIRAHSVCNSENRKTETFRYLVGYIDIYCTKAFTYCLDIIKKPLLYLAGYRDIDVCKIRACSVCLGENRKINIAVSRWI